MHPACLLPWSHNYKGKVSKINKYWLKIKQLHNHLHTTTCCIPDGSSRIELSFHLVQPADWAIVSDFPESVVLYYITHTKGCAGSTPIKGFAVWKKQKYKLMPYKCPVKQTTRRPTKQLSYPDLWLDSCCRFHQECLYCVHIPTHQNDLHHGRNLRHHSQSRSGQRDMHMAMLLSAWCWYDLKEKKTSYIGWQEKRNLALFFLLQQRVSKKDVLHIRKYWISRSSSQIKKYMSGFMFN